MSETALKDDGVEQTPYRFIGFRPQPIARRPHLGHKCYKPLRLPVAKGSTEYLGKIAPAAECYRRSPTDHRRNGGIAVSFCERSHVPLAEHARLFAVDLPGFGASERRRDLPSPRAMGGFLAQLITEADLGRPHIVGPDVGTSAALFAAAAHPERIVSVIVGTGGAAVPIQLGEPLAWWVLDPDLDKYRRMDPRAIVGAALDTIAG